MVFLVHSEKQKNVVSILQAQTALEPRSGIGIFEMVLFLKKKIHEVIVSDLEHIMYVSRFQTAIRVTQHYTKSWW